MVVINRNLNSFILIGITLGITITGYTYLVDWFYLEANGLNIILLLLNWTNLTGEANL